MTYTHAQLEIMTEAELEAIIAKDNDSADANEARYMLGKNMIEGSFPDRVPRNQFKGAQWVDDAARRGSFAALEYKTYFDIRFGRPNLEQVMSSLEKCATDYKSARACCTLAEVCHGNAKGNEGDKVKAALWYKQASDLGCVVGHHWLAVYYMEGFGVSQNLDKAEELLLKATKAGNGQSAYQLFIMYSSFP